MVEKGKTFKENAGDKAAYYSRFTKFLTMADDSGLVVDALDGKPGVYSARYLSEQASDRDRFCQILTELKDIPDSKRTAKLATINNFALSKSFKLFCSIIFCIILTYC